MVNEQFESITRRVRFDSTGWKPMELPGHQPCPTCHGSSYTHHVDEMPMKRIVGYREENGQTLYRLECGHIVAD